MGNSIKRVLICTDKSEWKPDGIAFTIELDNGMVAFDVCYNGNIKNISESIVLNDRILGSLKGLSGSMRMAAKRPIFTFDGRDPEALFNTLGSNYYLRELCKFMGLDRDDCPRKDFDVQIEYYELNARYRRWDDYGKT